MASSTSAAGFDRGPGGALATLAPATYAMLRIGAGLLFMEHGLQKLFGLFGGMGPNGGTVTLLSQMGLAGVLETFGGLLVVLGLFTRPVALLLAGEMLVAFFQAHLPRGGFPHPEQGRAAAALHAGLALLRRTWGGSRQPGRPPTALIAASAAPRTSPTPGEARRRARPGPESRRRAPPPDCSAGMPRRRRASATGRSHSSSTGMVNRLVSRVRRA